MSDELARRQRRLVATRRAAEGDAGAAAAGREAVGHRPARRRRRARAEQPADERHRLRAAARRRNCARRATRDPPAPRSSRTTCGASPRSPSARRDRPQPARVRAPAVGRARAEQDVADVMNRVLSLRAYEFRLNAIELETDFEPALPPVLGDGGQLQQALLNLLLNAEQAMRGAAGRKRLHVGARYVPRSGAVELFIADSGHGIAGRNLSPHLRSVLHDPRRRRGHRARPQHLLRHRPRSRRADLRREPGRTGDDVQAAAAGAERGAGRRNDRSSRTATRASATTSRRRSAAGAATS